MSIRSRWWLTAAILIAVPLSTVACSGRSADAGSGELAASTEASADGLADRDPDMAPLFTLNDVDGNPVSLSDTNGKVRLIDFWATWCAPCREEIPMLNELTELYGEQGFEILAISDENAEVIREFAEEHDINYTNLIGTEEISEKYMVLGLPTAFLLDQDGRVVGSPIFGPKLRKSLEPKIRELLDLPPET